MFRNRILVFSRKGELKTVSIFKKQCNLLPSAMGQKRKYGYYFFICLLGFFWLLVVIADAYKRQKFESRKSERNVLWKGKGICYCESNDFFALWQIKNDTYTGFFGFVCSKNGFIHRQSTKSQSHFLNLQKQWKHYRFNKLVAKNSYRKRSWKQVWP